MAIATKNRICDPCCGATVDCHGFDIPETLNLHFDVVTNASCSGTGCGTLVTSGDITLTWNGSLWIGVHSGCMCPDPSFGIYSPTRWVGIVECVLVSSVPKLRTTLQIGRYTAVDCGGTGPIGVNSVSCDLDDLTRPILDDCAFTGETLRICPLPAFGGCNCTNLDIDLELSE